MYLSNLIALFDTSFQSDQFQNLKHSNATDFEESLFSLSSRLVEFSNDFYRNLNLSVISGEYVSDPAFIDNLTNLSTKLSEAYLLDQDKITDEVVNRLNYLIISCFKIYTSSIKHYQYLHTVINREFAAAEGVHSFDAIKDEPVSGLHESLNVVLNLANEFRSMNVALAISDHYPIVSSDKHRQLVLLRISLEKRAQESNLVFKILLDKCTFLLRKIHLRYELNKLRYQYMVDFVEIQVGSENLMQDYFKDFEEATKFHYDIDQGKRIHEYSLSYHVSNSKFSKKESLLYSDFHCLVKYHKHTNSNWNRIVEVCDKFRGEIYSPTEIAFDRRAQEISANYFANSRLLAKLNGPDMAISTLANEMADIDLLQRETKVHNYFPFLKACNYLIKELESKFSPGKKNDFIQNFDQITLLLAYLKEYEGSLREKFEWCKEHRFSAFQLPFDECVNRVNINGESVDVFLCSSFVLPINYPIIEKEINDISTQLRAFETISKFQSSISDDLTQIRNIKETIDKTDKRHIEILSVFAAIVLFVSSNIQVFTRTETLAQALRFMLIFGYVLVLFVVVIWLITRETVFSLKKIPLIHWIIIVFLGITTIASFWLSSDLYIAGDGKLVSKRDTLDKAYIDSLVKVRVDKALKGKK